MNNDELKVMEERKQEELFFEWFDKINKMAEEHNVEIYKVVNARQIWDFGYLAGRVEGLKSALTTFDKSGAN